MMKAVIANGPKSYQFVDDKPIPQIGEGEALVKVLAAGVCGSDLKMYHGSEFYWGKGGRAHAGVIPGHEFVGAVVDIDPQLSKDQSIIVGDIVVAEQLLSCRTDCWFCQNGMEHKCDRLIIYGQGVDGCLSEFMIYQKGSWIHKVPKELTPTTAVLAEPLAVCVHAVERAALKTKDLVVISGCGTIGLGLAAAIQTIYPDVLLIILDYHQFKLDIATQILKTCRTFNLSNQTVSSIVEAVKKISGAQHGADVFFECSGSPDSIRAGLNFVRKCGKFVHVGISKEIQVDAPWNLISAGKELTIIGTNLGRGAWPRAFEILKTIDLSAMITHRLPLENFHHAFKLLDRGVKVILDPTLPASESISNGLTHPSMNVDCNVHQNGFSKIKEKVAFITGSSRGIGRAIAFALAKQGAHVIIHGTCHDSPSFLNEGTTMSHLATELSKLANNARVTPVWGDLTTEENVAAVLSQIHQEIDILVCCAGGNIGSSGVNTESGGKPCHDTCLTINSCDAKSIMDRNFWTTFYVCQSIVPQMVSRAHGQVIMIGSESALLGREKGALYTVSKAAVHQYMRCLATEVRSSGVVVNCIAPGPTLTERYKRNIGTSLGITEKPEHIANAVVQLLQMDFVHGQVIRVDGGEQTFPA